jgi:hypothetical protein
VTLGRSREVVGAVADLVQQHYVFADVGEQVAAALRSRTHDVSSEEELAALVTHELQSVNGDKHLRLIWHAQSVVDLADPAEAAAHHRRQAERSSYGVTGPIWLDGGVAVLTFEPVLFHPSVSGGALTTAMQSVGDAQGVVLDVRGCVGGAPSAVCLILTYLLGPELHLTDMVTRDPADLHQLWTLPWVPGEPVAPDVPVAVLTSSATFSGAEDLAYTLQAHGRAIVVGETTGGGAHPRQGFRVSDHLEATVPVARAVNRVTSGNWEGTGVVPDLPTSAEAALTAAHARLTSVTPG